MFSEKALFDTQVDLVKAATVKSVSHLSESYRGDGDYLSMPWIYATVATLVGFVAHGLVVSQVLKPSTGNVQVDAGLADVVKVGTVLTVSQAINTAMAGQVDLSEQWMTSTGVTLAAFFAFHVAVAPYVPKVEGRQAMVMDLAKAAFTSVAVQFVRGEEMNTEYFMTLAATLAGFAIFHEVIYPRVF
ncbi:hypothetical protein crov320 [Cafeteria roenbergensis virus]|uniref:Uncharacterized protein n=1 Tax=Cafeteria roenbergensis virus (strain BV-PW1) TaxID=693272 RepID=E3T591_CROVB|nr:hypothetical protein crov320 [Cafeteria roenbergensis virus BV-PW1]ADO67354.1 hypothetical protein crov320 [Cafeteria roenbergensis virus BV-PW1]